MEQPFIEGRGHDFAWVALSRMRLRICLSHARSELSTRSRAVLVPQPGPYIALLIPAATKDSKSMSVEKESSMSTATLAVHRIWTNGKETTAPHVTARQCVYAQQLFEPMGMVILSDLRASNNLCSLHSSSVSRDPSPTSQVLQQRIDIAEARPSAPLHIP